MGWLIILALLVAGFILYYQGKLSKSDESRKLAIGSPAVYKFPVNGNYAQEYLNDIQIGESIKIWANPSSQTELRLYAPGTYLGEGVLSVYDNRVLHDFILQHQGKKQFELWAEVRHKGWNKLTLTVNSRDNFKENIESCIGEVHKAFKGRTKTTLSFIIDFNKIEMSKSELSEQDKIQLGYTLESADEAITSMFYEWSEEKEKCRIMNEHVWLALDGMRISIGNTSQTGNARVLRAFLSGFQFKGSLAKEQLPKNNDHLELKPGQEN